MNTVRFKVGQTAFALLVLHASASAQTTPPSGETPPPVSSGYRVSSPPQSLDHAGQNEGWGGILAMPPHFCAKVPNWTQAERVEVTMYNGNAIYLARVEFPENLTLFLVTSTLPPGLSDEQDTEQAWLRNQRWMQKPDRAGGHVSMERIRTRFGTELDYTSENTGQSNRGPFPLELNFYSIADGSVRSVSAHRLVAERGQRFEVVAFERYATTTSESEKRDHRKTVEQAADALMNSVQQCTAQLWALPPERSKATP